MDWRSTVHLHNFPATHWSKLAQVGSDANDEHRQAINFLLGRYWKPVYSFLLRSGCRSEDAKDLTQEFFTVWLTKNLFGRADAARGKFRSYLLASLKNFVVNRRKYEAAQKRAPAGGFVSIHALGVDWEIDNFAGDRATPEDTFEQTWITELLYRVLSELRTECEQTGKEKHYRIFCERIVDPVLSGGKESSVKDLACRLELKESQVSNHLITARRAFQRLLREEIRAYVVCEDEIDQEIKELFVVLARLQKK